MVEILNNVENILRSAMRIKTLLPNMSSRNRGRDEKPSYKEDYEQEQRRGASSNSKNGGSGSKSQSSSSSSSAPSSKSSSSSTYKPTKEHLEQEPLPFSGEFDFVEYLGDHEDYNMTMQQPQKICYDRQNNLIFVSENRNVGRINVFHGTSLDFKYNFELKEIKFDIQAMEADPKGDGIFILETNKLTKLSINGRQQLWSIKFDEQMVDMTIDPKSGKVYLARDSGYSGLKHASVCVVDSSNGSFIADIGKDLDGYCVVQKVSFICLNNY